MRILGLFAAVTLAAACGDSERSAPIYSFDAGTRDAATTEDGSLEDACVPLSDEALCAEHEIQCGPLEVEDGCGTWRIVEECGPCAEGVCGELEPGRCACTPESDAELCDAAGAECGALEAVDACGAERVVASCGSCQGYESCGGGGESNVCGCAPESDTELCAEVGAVCGDLVITDVCGVEREVDCGAEAEVCEGYESCGGGGEPNVCGCTPKTCASEAMMCGTLDDGCGGEVQCDQFCVDVVRAGVDHACAASTSGALRCWGRNSGGQLGTGNTTGQQNPAEVIGISGLTIRDVALGERHTCALTDEGSVYCWGRNDSGQLGVGTTVNSTSAGAPAIYEGATAIGAGASHTCALVHGGVQCWGSNQYGQIGREELNYGVISSIPQHVTNLASGVLELAVGAHHACALKDDGAVWCWGRNQYGQLGNLVHETKWNREGTGEDCAFVESEPEFSFASSYDADLDLYTRPPGVGAYPVEVEGLSGVVEIVSGDTVSCARDDLGVVRCWGVLSRPHSTATPCPAIDGRTPIRCAIWPSEDSGQTVSILRRGTTSECCDDDCRDPAVQRVLLDRAAFSPLEATAEVEAMSAGADHLCFLVSDAAAGQTNVRCMGANASGQLGDGTDNPWPSPQDIFRDSDGNVVRAEAAALGAAFSCALTGEDAVQCWGSNQYGQIGNSELLQDESLRPFWVRLVYMPIAAPLDAADAE